MLSSSPQYQVATGYLTNLYVAQIERSHHPLPAMLHPRGSNKGIQEPMIVNVQKFRHKDTKTYQPIPGIPVLDWMMSPHMRGVRAFCILLQPTHTQQGGILSRSFCIFTCTPPLSIYHNLSIHPSRCCHKVDRHKILVAVAKEHYLIFTNPNRHFWDMFHVLSCGNVMRNQSSGTSKKRVI